MADQEDLDEKIASSIADEVMSFVEEGEDPETRNTRDKIQAFDEQIGELHSSSLELELKINEAIETLDQKKKRLKTLIERREIEHVKLFHLEKMARDYAGES